MSIYCIIGNAYPMQLISFSHQTYVSEMSRKLATARMMLEVVKIEQHYPPRLKLT